MTTPQAPAPRAEQPPSASINTGANLAPVLRKHVTTALCAAALAGGAWAIGIRPLEASLSRQSQEAARMRSEVAVAAMDTQGIDQLEQARNLAAQRADSTLAWASQSDDATEIYDAFSRIARAAGVNLQRIDPTGSRTTAARNTSRAPVAKKPAAPAAEVLGYRISIQGTYPQIVEFLGACETQLGASRIVAFRLSANAMVEEGGRTDLLDASIETAHIKLTMPASPRRPRVEDRNP
jgi:hypothetical protein